MIEVVGIGLDGAQGLNAQVLKIVESATLLIGSARHLSYFPQHQATRLVIKSLLTTLEVIKAKSPQESIVILTSGDPLFFGLGRLLLEHLPPEKLRFHPHISSLQLAFNRLKISWTDVHIISAHGRCLEPLIELLQKGVIKIAILTDNYNTPQAIAQLYLSLKVASKYQIYVAENLGGIEEKITSFASDDVSKLANLNNNSFAALNIVILIKDEELPLIEDIPLLGIDDDNFASFSDQPGLMTKKEVRLIVLGELALQPSQIIWDIGAGTGSVSIEIARLCPNSQIYAIEKTAMGITLIQQNCQRLGVNNVIPIYGNAPEILTDLPTPHRIFIGGSGGNLGEILTICEQKLVANGRIVMALATLENLHFACNWFSDRSWRYNLIQLNISRSVSLGKLTRWNPLNPVTIITASLH